MTANPIDLVGGLTNSGNVPKADITAWVKARVPQLLPRWPEGLGPDDFSFPLYRKNREYQALLGWLIGATWLVARAFWLPLPW